MTTTNKTLITFQTKHIEQPKNTKKKNTYTNKKKKTLIKDLE